MMRCTVGDSPCANALNPSESRNSAYAIKATAVVVNSPIGGRPSASDRERTRQPPQDSPPRLLSDRAVHDSIRLANPLVLRR